MGMKKWKDLPEAQGLYDPRNEHDACGIGFVANIRGERSYGIVDDALKILENLKHRGGEGADQQLALWTVELGLGLLHGLALPGAVIERRMGWIEWNWGG